MRDTDLIGTSPSWFTPIAAIAGVLLVLAALAIAHIHDYPRNRYVEPVKLLVQLRRFAGPGAMDCGYVPSHSFDNEVEIQCVETAMREQRAFWVAKPRRPGEGPTDWIGVARNARGQWSGMIYDPHAPEERDGFPAVRSIPCVRLTTRVAGEATLECGAEDSESAEPR